jgi:hypothetical protein
MRHVAMMRITAYAARRRRLAAQERHLEKASVQSRLPPT